MTMIDYETINLYPEAYSCNFKHEDLQKIEESMRKETQQSYPLFISQHFLSHNATDCTWEKNFI